ncbi:MAG TPA: single-stranded DNA-binding protein [Mycobacteriales bacterium]|nr:single-stranded DNA-binding protein [Mycobacteriales bacterium]
MSDSMTYGSDVNRVYLRGRLAAEAVARTLPSGDELCVFRLTVDRPDGDRVRVDSLDCAASKARVRHTVARARPGDELEVSGSLRRRFWRGAGGLSSRYEVAVVAARITVRQRAPRRRSDA